MVHTWANDRWSTEVEADTTVVEVSGLVVSRTCLTSSPVWGSAARARRHLAAIASCSTHSPGPSPPLTPPTPCQPTHHTQEDNSEAPRVLQDSKAVRKTASPTMPWPECWGCAVPSAAVWWPLVRWLPSHSDSCSLARPAGGYHATHTPPARPVGAIQERHQNDRLVSAWAMGCEVGLQCSAVQ